MQEEKEIASSPNIDPRYIGKKWEGTSHVFVDLEKNINTVVVLYKILIFKKKN